MTAGRLCLIVMVLLHLNINRLSIIVSIKMALFERERISINPVTYTVIGDIILYHQLSSNDVQAYKFYNAL